MRKTECGWLLDVINVYANARNFGFDGYDFIVEVMSSAERGQMHLTGGYYDEKVDMYIDSHSHSLPDQVWDLYRFALETVGDRASAVFVERDQNFPDEQGWRYEILRVRQIVEDTVGQQV